ncbi:MAG: cobalt ECF transporter T component CbiQ [Leptospirillia bacterium]
MPLDIDRHADVESPIQRWDPRLKILSLMVFIFGVALLKTLPMALLALVVVVAVLRMSALPFHFVKHGLEAAGIFLLPFFLIMPFSYPGEAAFQVLGMGFAWEGLRFATLIFTKAVTIIMGSFIMFGTARFDISMIALERLRCPPMLVQMLLFTYRYIYVFMEDMKTLNVAMRARGFVPRTNLRTMNILGGYVGTLLVRSFERTERVYKAMLSKGYNGSFPSMVTFSADTKDFVKAAIVLAVAAGLLAGDMSGIFSLAVDAWY